MPFDFTELPTRPHNHEVRFYSNDAVFAATIGNFVSAALTAGNASIVFATKPHRESLLHALKLQGVDVDAAIVQGTFISLDAAETLSLFMVNGWPDRARFFEGFGQLVDSASKAAAAPDPRIAIFGEGVALLCDQGEPEAAIRLEQLGNDLANKYAVDILCGYPLSLCTKEHENEIRRICAQHSAAYSA